jgi:hypothetical protein
MLLRGICSSQTAARPGRARGGFSPSSLPFSGLLPISLYVSTEITRGFKIYFMVHYEQMKDHQTGIAAEVWTSNFIEDLGMVD